MKKLKDKILNFWYNIIEQYKLYRLDKKNKKLFPKVIEEENNDRDSLYNKYNLRSLDDYTKVVQIIDIPEEYQLKGQQWQIMDKLNENSYFTTIYLKDTLNFKDNIVNPEYYHIEDPSSNTPLSCRYLAIWQITPVLKSKKLIYIINSILTVLAVSILSIIGFLIYINI